MRCELRQLTHKTHSFLFNFKLYKNGMFQARLVLLVVFKTNVIIWVFLLCNRKRKFRIISKLTSQ